MIETTLLGDFLSRAVFTRSIDESCARLRDTIWLDELPDEAVLHCIRRNDSYYLCREFIDSGRMLENARLFTVNRIMQLLRSDGPPLYDVMSKSIEQLKSAFGNVLNSIPLTQEETHLDQLARARNSNIPKRTIFQHEAKVTWQHKTGPPVSYALLYRTVWWRINYAGAMLERHAADPVLVDKLNQFIDAHIPVVTHLDSLDNVDNVHHLDDLYRPLGPSMYACDYSKITTHTEHIQVRPTSLETIQLHFNALVWTVPEMIESIERGHNIAHTQLDDCWTPVANATMQTHSRYLACVTLIHQCRTCMDESSETPSHILDALWEYHCSFLDLFYYGLCVCTMSDEELLAQPNSRDQLSLWERFGTNLDIRTFCAGDLPDLFHVLNIVPLWGEQNTPPFRVGKIYQKALPFACQRRHIIRPVSAGIAEDPAFASLYCRLTWVLLAGLYPGQDRSALTFRDLLRARELTDDADLLSSVIQMTGENKNGAPLLVHTTIRMHVIYMASLNPTYIEKARNCIDWDQFVKSTEHMAQLIRESNLFPADPFERARKLLSKTAKSPDTRVHRIRRESICCTIASCMNEILEKDFIKDKFARRVLPESEENTRVLSLYNRILNVRCKSAILNMLIRIPAADRLTIAAFSMLTLPEYGSVCDDTIDRLYQLTEVYRGESMPKDFDCILDKIDGDDFAVCTYYFNMVVALERIHLLPLDAEMVKRTDETMITRRYKLFPGQKLPDSAYTVYIALCCERVCNILGKGKYGTKSVAFDLERETYVCTKRVKQKIDDNDDDDDDDTSSSSSSDDDDDNDNDINPVDQIHQAEQDEFDMDFLSDAMTRSGRGKRKTREMTIRKAVRIERKQFNRIPCGMPVIPIQLRGYMLVYGTRLEKQVGYLFCPECGTLHIYTVLNFSNAPHGRYRCNECARAQPGQKEIFACAYCTTTGTTGFKQLQVMCPKEAEVEKTHQLLHFCKRHYDIAKRNHTKLTRDALWKYIKAEDERRIQFRLKKYGK